jgi:hypothetical protein
MQRVPVLPADLVPDLAEHVTGSLAPASIVVQLHPLADGSGAEPRFTRSLGRDRPLRRATQPQHALGGLAIKLGH